jgi:hypothetical protein
LAKSASKYAVSLGEYVIAMLALSVTERQLKQRQCASNHKAKPNGEASSQQPSSSNIFLAKLDMAEHEDSESRKRICQREANECMTGYEHDDDGEEEGEEEEDPFEGRFHTAEVSLARLQRRNPRLAVSSKSNNARTRVALLARSAAGRTHLQST